MSNRKTVQLDADLHDRLKHLAIDLGVTMADLLDEMVFEQISRVSGNVKSNVESKR